MTSYNWIYTHWSVFTILEGLVFMPNLSGGPAQPKTDVAHNCAVLHALFNTEYSTILKPDKTYILSAKHGLLKLNEVIEPYNETLNTKKRNKQQEWAKIVLSQIKKECDVNNDTFIFLAGQKYYRDLIQLLPNHKIIMENMPIGIRLQWLTKEIGI